MIIPANYLGRNKPGDPAVFGHGASKISTPKSVTFASLSSVETAMDALKENGLIDAWSYDASTGKYTVARNA